MAKVILIAEDSSSVRTMMRVALADSGYDVVEACDGIEALERLKGPIDAVVTDLTMPRADGVAVIRGVRVRPEYHDIPVIVLFTEMEGSKRDEAHEAGATAWIGKPFGSAQFAAVVRKVLG